MSRITDICKKNNIQDLSEISHLEAFFQDPDINKELENAEKFRKIRYLVLIPLLTLLTIGISIFFQENKFEDILQVIVMVDIITAAIVIAIFRSKIEGAIKDRILTKLSKELYSKLEYNQSKKYAFGDTRLLVNS